MRHKIQVRKLRANIFTKWEDLKYKSLTVTFFSHKRAHEFAAHQGHHNLDFYRVAPALEKGQNTSIDFMVF